MGAGLDERRSYGAVSFGTGAGLTELGQHAGVLRHRLQLGQEALDGFERLAERDERKTED